MNKIWADRLIAGTRTFDEVPASRKEAVKELLLEYVNKNKLFKERYQEITGEKYEAS